jgi:hypothetical protein
MSIDTLPSHIEDPLSEANSDSAESAPAVPEKKAKKGFGGAALGRIFNRRSNVTSLQAEKDIMFTPEAKNQHNPASHGASELVGPTWHEAQADNEAWDATKHEEDNFMDLRAAQQELRRLTKERETVGDAEAARLDGEIAQKSTEISRLQKAHTAATRQVAITRSTARARAAHRQSVETTQLYLKKYGQR